MANIFGTILSIGDFLKRGVAEVTIVRGDGTNQKFFLSEDRKYIIPDYQREIRWSKENLIELISDISRGDKFLGNIILNKRSASEYEVIDGQQRITVLLMIICFIRSKFSQELDIFQTCKLEMANFDRFDLLLENNFNMDSLSPDDKVLLDDSDVFNQRIRYQELWNVFNNIDMLKIPADCDDFLTNLRRSQVNLIANTIDTDSYSIDYFMDVNLKGVKLDKEDIFKGYLFSQDSSKTIRDEWKTFKILSFKLNNIFKLNKITEYPATKLLEHYLYCSLYKDDKYKNVQFREDFSIYEVELDGIRHYTGEHIIKVIRNNAYMVQSLKNTNLYLNIVLNILNSESPSQSFKDLFNSSVHIDNVEITIIHNFIKKIMQDKNVVPRILIMKYVIEVLFDNTDRTKEDYRKIYGAYLLAILFTVFEGDKDIKKVLGVVKDTDWYTKVVEQSKSYFSRSKISDARITVQYKLLDSDGTENYMYRCKSLATIYNFFEIGTNTVGVINGKMSELKAYLSDSDRFSNEHFIINNSRAFKIVIDTNSRSFNYPSSIRKYANSIFNFIFISRQLNQELESYILFEKIRIIDEKVATFPEIIECEFSKMIIERCKTDFARLMVIPTENIDIDDVGQAINSFYQNEFIEVFSNYASGVIKKIGNKLGVL